MHLCHLGCARPTPGLPPARSPSQVTEVHLPSEKSGQKPRRAARGSPAELTTGDDTSGLGGCEDPSDLMGLTGSGQGPRHSQGQGHHSC